MVAELLWWSCCDGAVKAQTRSTAVEAEPWRRSHCGGAAVAGAAVAAEQRRRNSSGRAAVGGKAVTAEWRRQSGGGEAAAAE